MGNIYPWAVVKVTKDDRLWLFERCRELRVTFSTYLRGLFEVEAARNLLSPDDPPEVRALTFPTGSCRAVAELTQDEYARLRSRLRALGRNYSQYTRELFKMNQVRHIWNHIRRPAEQA